jgi:sporulation protein YtfJ
VADNKMSDIIRTSLDGIRDFADINTSVGAPIVTQSGVTVIPISKVSIGLATGGVDFGAKKILPNQSFGGGGGTGVSITPLGFLTIDRNSNINLIKLSQNTENAIDKAISVIENSTSIISKIKDVFS